MECRVGFTINPIVAGKVFVGLVMVTRNVMAIGLARCRLAARLASQYPIIQAA